MGHLCFSKALMLANQKLRFNVLNYKGTHEDNSK